MYFRRENSRKQRRMEMSEVCSLPVGVLSREAATECSLGRQPGVNGCAGSSPEGAKDINELEEILRPFRGWDLDAIFIHGLRPWLHSCAAPRLVDTFMNNRRKRVNLYEPPRRTQRQMLSVRRTNRRGRSLILP